MRRLGSTAWVWIALATAAGLLGCGKGRPLGKLEHGLRAQDLDVLLVTLDTTRADRIGVFARPRGMRAPETPVLDALAARGARFDNAVSVTPLTLPAHCTLHTGLVPAAHGVRDNGGFRLSPERVTLAEVLRGAGFRTGGFVSAYVLDHKWGIDQGFERYYDDFDEEALKKASMGEIQRSGDLTVAEAVKWLDSVAGQRFFAWVHLYDPHTPYAPPEPFKSRYPGEPYNGEIAWTDSLVGRLLDELERRGLRDRTIVAVIGDHGESLGDHGEGEHGYFIYESTAWVPFLLDAPYERLRGREVTEPVGQADLAPTLLELAGVANGLEAGQGRSLVPLLAGVAEEPSAPPRGYSETFLARLHYGWAELRALRKDRWHFIEAPRAELYDVVADPGEQKNLADQERRVVRDLRADLAAHDATVVVDASASAPVEEDEETLRALAALGYVGGQAIDTGKSFRDLPDPKDRLEVYGKMAKARGLAKSEDPGRAAPVLEEILGVDPEVVDAWFTLGNVRFRLRDWEGAAEAYRETLKRRPDHDWAQIGLADTFVARGDVDAAVLGYRNYLATDPRNAQILYRLAQVLTDAGRDDEAEAAFRKTLEVEPKTARAEVGLAVLAFRRKDFGGAHAALDRAVAIDPKAKFASYNRALLDETEGNTAEAIAGYRKEIALHPDAYKAHFNLGRLLERTGDAAGGMAELRAAVGARSDFGLGYLYLARALLVSGRIDEAEEAARRGLELESGSAFAALGHYVLADVYSRRGRRADAAHEAALGREAEARGGRERDGS